MFDLIPWLDETFIVEVGRLFLCGGDPNSIVLTKDGTSLLTPYYVGPCIQEISFRLLGALGPHLSPFVGLGILWLCFRSWLRQTNALPKLETELVALLALTAPLFFQSAILARPDTWPVASACAALAILGPASAKKSVARLFFGAFFAVLAPFIWPTAIVLCFLYPAVCFCRKQKRDFIAFCGFAGISAIIIGTPLFTKLPLFLRSFGQHCPTMIPLMDSLVAFAKEIARAPFLAILTLVGGVLMLRKRQWAFLFAFLFALAVCFKTNLYAFRIIYLMPFFLIMCAEATSSLLPDHQKGTRTFLYVSIAYGILTGPIGHQFLSYPTLPKTLKADLAEIVGTGPIRVFAPDHATYYIGRELGWRQLGFFDPTDCNDKDALKRVLDRSDAVVLRDFDPYTPFQQNCTPYGLFCKYVLDSAKKEAELPPEQKSRAAKFGSKFSFAWHAPLDLSDFTEVRKIDMIRVFLRKRTN